MKKEYSQRYAESRRISLGTPVSTHRESLQGDIGYTGPR